MVRCSAGCGAVVGCGVVECGVVVGWGGGASIVVLTPRWRRRVNKRAIKARAGCSSSTERGRRTASSRIINGYEQPSCGFGV
ncbi:hypothetical protein PsorP6_003570 [Peronosclerospora sorghi]|uniref:Uncharacterized protein n=1 Tax=Peronosclerospora sorghi TaxID=230839 RepID=A0ACC0VQQ3_9STRA|nr:hypothetical protein PsorP6_003570 [Peronosclerospora sorghi]